MAFLWLRENDGGTKSEVDESDRLREVEKKYIVVELQGEREEIRQILKQKGPQGALLEDQQTLLCPMKIWINTMLVEEYGVSPVLRNPLISTLRG